MERRDLQDIPVSPTTANRTHSSHDANSRSAESELRTATTRATVFTWKKSSSGGCTESQGNGDTSFARREGVLALLPRASAEEAWQYIQQYQQRGRWYHQQWQPGENHWVCCWIPLAMLQLQGLRLLDIQAKCADIGYQGEISQRIAQQDERTQRRAEGTNRSTAITTQESVLEYTTAGLYITNTTYNLFGK